MLMRPGFDFPPTPFKSNKHSDRMMNGLLKAIVDDQPATARKLLARNPDLAMASFGKPVLYQTKIFHWLYPGDTALHLAAAGYRLEIAGLLLAAGADPNAANNHRHSGPLHYAADGYLSNPGWDEKLQVKTLELLLKSGAEINAQDKNGA